MKKLPLKLLFFLLILNLPFQAFAQNQANIWYFGKYAGLDFQSGSPKVLLDSRMKTNNFRASTMSDSNGKLLFYTDGRTVWGGDHQPMLNGTDLKGEKGNVITVALPQNPNIYYIFTTEPTWVTTNPPNNQGALHYNIVDLSKNQGKGEVVLKNQKLHVPISNQLEAVRHTYPV